METSNFIRTIIEEDLESGKHTEVVTRFPPEPNGYLHIGHAKSICLNFGLPKLYSGRCHLRFDDTNPATEEDEYVRAIQRDILWLGFDWNDHLHFASDYFPQLYAWAELLIEGGHAFVCDLNSEEVRATRGSVTEAGTNSPNRDRSVAENLDLFRRMRAGEFDDGARTLRAKIDMSHANMKLRDPPLYRIRKISHHRTADTWCIYPFYDYAHCTGDAIEGITHSICTLEFENNRALYDWILERVAAPCHPRQIEFARLHLSNTIMSKRKMLQLVKEGHVEGWDDPRMPTIAAMRRRGYTPEALRHFAERVGVAKANSLVDLELLEHSVRGDLNTRAPRVMCVLDPLKLVITNWPAGQTESLEAPLWPHDVAREGSRSVPFSREILIERSDFAETPSKGFHRLAPGREVRLRYGYFISCTEVIKDSDGRVVELRCTYDPATRGGDAPDGRKVKGTLHWVSSEHAVRCEVRMYDRLFLHERPAAAPGGFLAHLNPDSRSVSTGYIEPSVLGTAAGAHFQFERLGYFFTDPDTRESSLVFNKVVGLRDSWARSHSQTTAPAIPTRKSPEPSRPPTPPPIRVRDPEVEERMDALGKLGVGLDEAGIIAESADLTAFVVSALDHAPASAVAKWVVNELMRTLNDTAVGELRFEGSSFGKLIGLVENNAITARSGKEVLGEMIETGAEPEAIVSRRGLEKIDDVGAIQAIMSDLVATYPRRVADYRAGRRGLMGFFIGQIMKQTGGQANPQTVRSVVERALDQ